MGKERESDTIRLNQIEVSSLDDVIPRLPVEVILEHGSHGVRHVALLRRQVCIHVAAKVSSNLLDDDGAVGYLGSVQLDERQLALGRAEFHLMINVLRRRRGVNMKKKRKKK